jgi:dTDP-glucose pyrophosphorylase
MRSVKNISVPTKATIRQVLEKIDSGNMQIAFVVDNDLLLGTVTDGDIRRGFLSGMGLDDSIENLYNSNPVKGYISQPKENLVQLALARGIKQLPMIDDGGKLVGVEIVDDYLRVTKKPNAVVLMAGGLGTRLRPLTTNTPKPMLTVGSKPILETIIENFSRYGFHNFYLSVNYKAEKIREYFGDGQGQGVSITYLSETKRLGTAGALNMLPEDLDSPIIVMNGDLLTNINFEHLLNYHLLTEADATMCVREYDFQVPYGVVRSEGAVIQSIIEKPTYQYYVNAGIYVLNPSVLKHIPAGENFDMPQLFDTLIEHKQKACSFPIHEYWMDIGQPNDFEKANDEYEEFFHV